MEEKTKSVLGRRKVSSRDRSGSFSRRAALGKILFEDITCPDCGHDKCKVYNATSSPKFNMHKCTKCGYEF
jgi:rubredoxin